jgi:hypothetical protein
MKSQWYRQRVAVLMVGFLVIPLMQVIKFTAERDFDGATIWEAIAFAVFAQCTGSIYGQVMNLRVKLAVAIVLVCVVKCAQEIAYPPREDYGAFWTQLLLVSTLGVAVAFWVYQHVKGVVKQAATARN